VTDSAGVLSLAAVPAAMSVAGLCQVCESARADRQCEQCGSLVCREHFDARLGACVECARESGQRRI
jgi:hypothetical protein